MTREQILDLDQRHLWHPYTQHADRPDFVPITRAEEVWVEDANGARYLDGISSWWVAPYGHRHPAILKGISEQLETLDHILFGGFTHEPAARFAQELLPHLPEGVDRIFFSDNGSTAVEVALKASIQYFYNRGKRRTRILALEDAFHGDTFGAMSASGIGLFTQMFAGQLLEVVRIPLPTQEEAYFEELKNLLEQENFACFIYEPLVQGAAGMRMYPAEALSRVLGCCKAYGVLCIADEVMTGFGKTGTFLASDQVEVKPDIICLSKALTAGVLPMAVTVFRQEIFHGFDGEVDKAFFHGHTFTANPVGCAAAIASLQVYHSDEMQFNLAQLVRWQKEKAQFFQSHIAVQEVRVCGGILALDLKVPPGQSYYGELRNFLYQACMDRKLILRPVGSTLYTMPPYSIQREEFNLLYQGIEEVLASFVKKYLS